jgi:hypothetical protein
MLKTLNIFILFIMLNNVCYGKTDVTYYAFVMYQPKGENWQFLSDTTNKLEVGSYRFQLVYIQSNEQSFALRGEFEFVTDTVKGGVKLKTIHNLDEVNQIDADKDATNFSLWLPNDSKYSWNKVGRKQVQPLINQMNKSLIGDPEPNFMRFLIRKKEVEESWQADGINYRIYRLHYFKKDSFNQAQQLQIVSRFINPSFIKNHDIQILNRWVSETDGFSLARYLGKPDINHKVFFQDFKIWLNYIFDISSSQAEIVEQDETSWNWLWIVLGILFGLVVIAIVVIMILKYFPKIHKLNDKKSQTAKMNSYSQMSKNEVKSLIKTELKQIRTDIIKEIEGKGSEIISNIVAEYFNKYVPEIIEKSFVKLLYKNARVLSDTKELKKAVRNEVQYYIQQEFKDWEQRLNSYADEYWQKFIEEKTAELETSVEEDSKQKTEQS